jgi:hypothetical protein
MWSTDPGGLYERNWTKLSASRLRNSSVRALCWNQSDSEAYEQNKIGNIPAAKIISVLEAVTRRTPTRINSFKYFLKEITAQPDPRNRAWQKKRLETIVHQIRNISVGRGDYSMADFVDDVKCSCAREGVVFDNDSFNELVC